MSARSAAALVLVCALTACGGATEQASPTSTPSPNGEREVDALERDVDALERDVDALGTDDAPDPTPSSVPAPTPTTRAVEAAATFDLEGCPDAARGAVADKTQQRYWLCADGVAITDEIPMTTASDNYGLPPVGTYPVFARDEDAFGIHGEALERFVAFYTTTKGNRIAFHEVVNQDPETVGDLDQRGASAGCFRVREADSKQVWDFLQLGDPVVIIT